VGGVLAKKSEKKQLMKKMSVIRVAEFGNAGRIQMRHTTELVSKKKPGQNIQLKEYKLRGGGSQARNYVTIN